MIPNGLLYISMSFKGVVFSYSTFIDAENDFVCKREILP